MKTLNWKSWTNMRSHYRKKLNRLLEIANDESFIQLLWATHLLQSEHSDIGRRYFRPETVPDAALTGGEISEYSIQEWEIETLANELMTVPKTGLESRRATRSLHCDHFGAISECVNQLRKLEDAEYKVQKKPRDILVELGRIAARQFDWQRGYLNMAQFCRNAFIYGQGECSSYFWRKNGITLDRFSEIGFMLFVSLLQAPVVHDGEHWEKLGVTWEEVERVLAKIALPFQDAAKLARRERSKIIHTADKPSILRQAPCLRFGSRGERVRAPLPELILDRITSGVFYDIVDGGGSVRDEYGKRFEAYCARYLSESLPGLNWEQEFKYRKKPNFLNTPDILCSDRGEIIFALECKATRMSHAAIFGRDPMQARGYDDLAKAVFQLWRFFSHCRRGHAPRSVAPEAVGIVLTLDNWLVMAEPLREYVMQKADEIVREKEPEIAQEDRKRIAFVTVSELERILSIATETTFREAVHASNTDGFRGWRLDSILRALLGGREAERRRYPYADDLGKLLPWWGRYAGGP